MCLLILNLKSLRSQVKRKGFPRQRIAESSYARKETVKIDIIILYTNNNRKIMTSLENKDMTPVEQVQMNVNKSNTYRKDLTWLHLDNDPRVQEEQQVKEQQPCISVFVAYLTFSRSSQDYQPRYDNSIPYKTIWKIYRDTGQPQEKET